MGIFTTRRKVPAASLGAVPALGLVLACTGTIDSLNDAPGGPNGDGNGPGAGSTSAGNGGSGNGSGSSWGGSGSAAGQPRTCDSNATYAGPAPLARLTTLEYGNTIAALFPRSSLAVTDYTLPAEVATEGFTNTAETQTPSAELIEALSNNARAIADRVTGTLSQVLPCSPASPSEESACGRQFVREFGRRAFRGDFPAPDQSSYEGFFDESYGKWGFRVAVQLVIEAMLQAPKFLYRMEAGTAAGSAVKLGSHEIANRLSYFLTDTMPDDALLAAAERDELGEPAALEAQARRLFQGQAARDALSTFTGQWLRFDKLDTLMKAPDLFPAFSRETAAALKQATRRYVDDLVWDQGHDLRALLTDDHAYVNAAIAPLYDLTAGGTELARAPVDGTKRSGILTQAGLLAGFAHERTGAPVLRGVFVLDRLLCMPPPSPPRGVNTVLPDLTAATGLTTRQQLEQTHVKEECIQCHDAIDGVGFGFESFDAVGKFRTTEFGMPVDDSGELRGTDVDGAFEGAVELGLKLADSAQVRECVANQALRYALAAERDDVSRCMVDRVAKDFVASGEDLRELFIAVVKSDAFRYRQAE